MIAELSSFPGSSPFLDIPLRRDHLMRFDQTFVGMMFRAIRLLFCTGDGIRATAYDQKFSLQLLPRIGVLYCGVT
jgi:hypothetical protein